MVLHPAVFPKVFTSMVKAGEVGGNLDQILERLAHHYEVNHDLKEKVKSALTYPLIVVAIAQLTVIALLIFVIPTFVKLLTDLQAPIPVLTAIIINFSNFIRGSWFTLVVFILTLLYGYRQFKVVPSGKRILDRAALNFPICGGLIRRVKVTRFCSTLALLLHSGIPLLQALAVVKHVSDNYQLAEAVSRAEESIIQGHGLAVPLGVSGIFPPMVIKLITIGEQSGSLDTMLEKVSLYYEKEITQIANRLSAMLEPILICLIGGVVGLIIISILLPVFSVMNSLQ
jgi:type IV pilus assembly protein PilC